MPRERSARTVWRVLFWLTLAAVAAATLCPIGLRPETPFGPDIERLGAFAAASLFLGLAYPRHRGISVVALLVAAGLLEGGQTLIPGRHGRLHDVEVKAIGIVLGALTAVAADGIVSVARRTGERVDA